MQLKIQLKCVNSTFLKMFKIQIYKQLQFYSILFFSEHKTLNLPCCFYFINLKQKKWQVHMTLSSNWSTRLL
jgi:hypothetical protein